MLLHKFYLQAQKSVPPAVEGKDKDEHRDQQVGKWEGQARRHQQTPDEEPSLGILPAHVEEPANHTMGQCFQSIMTWLRNLQSGDGLQSIWLSSYQSTFRTLSSFHWRMGIQICPT